MAVLVGVVATQWQNYLKERKLSGTAIQDLVDSDDSKLSK